MRNRNLRWTMILALILTTLACNFPGYDGEEIAQDTPIPLPTATNTVAPNAPTNTVAPDEAEETTIESEVDGESCELKSAFLDDVTIPDDSEVPTGEVFTKTWRVHNNGTCPWETGTQLVFHSGEDIGTVKQIDVPATAPDSTLNLSVQMTAPTEPGAYRSNWQLQTPGGERYGSVYYVKFVVAGEAEPTPTATPEISAVPFMNFAGKVAEDCSSVQFTWQDGTSESSYKLSGGDLEADLPANSDSFTWQNPTAGTTGLTLQALDADGGEVDALETTIVVACSEGVADLSIEDVLFEPVEPTAFLPISMTVTIKNGGDVDTGSFKVQWSDGSPSNIEACSWWVNSLEAGETLELHCDDYAYMGSYVDIVTEISVDSTGIIHESDETNNTYKQTIDVVPPVTAHELIVLADTASWTVGPPATAIAFGGEGAGSAAWSTQPLENGLLPQGQCLLVQPDDQVNGWIQGTYDSLGTDGYTIKEGDVLYARAAMHQDAIGAEVNFKVLLRLVGSGSNWIADVPHIYGEGIETIWVDLNSYAGTEAVVVLVVEGGADTTNDMACWLDAVIYTHPAQE